MDGSGSRGSTLPTRYAPYVPASGCRCARPIQLVRTGPLPNREFVRVLGRATHRPAFLPVPAVAFRLLFGEMAAVLLDGQRVVPRHLVEQGFTFQYPEAGAALRHLLA